MALVSSAKEDEAAALGSISELDSEEVKGIQDLEFTFSNAELEISHLSCDREESMVTKHDGEGHVLTRSGQIWLDHVIAALDLHARCGMAPVSSAREDQAVALGDWGTMIGVGALGATDRDGDEHECRSEQWCA